MLHDRQLAEIPRLAHGTSGHELWSLATAGDDRWALVIREVCGSDADPVYHGNEWRFRVCRAGETIPRLIGRLAEAGCSIGKVAPLKNEFSETIRSEYRKKASNDERLKP